MTWPLLQTLAAGVIGGVTGFLLARIFTRRKNSSEESLNRVAEALIHLFDELKGLRSDLDRDLEKELKENAPAEPEKSLSSSRKDSAEEPQDVLHRQIRTLVKEGYTVEEISRKVGAAKGEVELILNLYRFSRKGR